MNIIKSWVRISFNFLLFPFLYPLKKVYTRLSLHFAVQEELPEKADYVVALGCSLRSDGSAANPTRDRAQKTSRSGAKNALLATAEFLDRTRSWTAANAEEFVRSTTAWRNSLMLNASEVANQAHHERAVYVFVAPRLGSGIRHVPRSSR